MLYFIMDKKVILTKRRALKTAGNYVTKSLDFINDSLFQMMPWRRGTRYVNAS